MDKTSKFQPFRKRRCVCVCVCACVCVCECGWWCNPINWNVGAVYVCLGGGVFIVWLWTYVCVYSSIYCYQFYLRLVIFLTCMTTSTLNRQIMIKTSEVHLDDFVQVVAWLDKTEERKRHRSRLKLQPQLVQENKDAVAHMLTDQNTQAIKGWTLLDRTLQSSMWSDCFLKTMCQQQ